MNKRFFYFSGSYIQLLKNYRINHGEDPVSLLHSAKVDESVFLNPPVYISAKNFLCLIEAFFEGVDDPILQCIDYGIFESKVNAHGNLGMAVRTSPTLAQGFWVLSKYSYTRQNIFDLVIREEKNQFIVQFSTQFPSKSKQQSKSIQHLLFSTMVNLLVVSRHLLSSQTVKEPVCCIHAPISLDPHHIQRLKPLADWQQSQRHYEIHFDQRAMSLPLPSASPSLHRSSIELCRHELFKAPQSSLVKQSAILHIENHHGSMTLVKLAKLMNMSISTLQRRLAEENTDFTEILFQTRIELAKDMLKNTSLSVNEVAAKVGYQSVSSFIKGFKRALNITPLQFQKSMKRQKNKNV